MSTTVVIQERRPTVTIDQATAPIIVTKLSGGIKGDKGDKGDTGEAGTTDHLLLQNIGTNTHAQIDTALSRLANTSGTNTGDQDLSGYATTSALSNHTGLTTTAHGGIIADTDPRLTDARTPVAHNHDGDTLKPDVLLLETPAVIPTAIGSRYWDADNHTTALVTSADTTIQDGQEVVRWCVNKDTVALPNGTVVRIVVHPGEPLAIARASAQAEEASYLLGVTTQDITYPNGAGFVTLIGAVNGLNTAAYDEGTPVFLSTIAGEWTATKPTAPYHGSFIGTVARKHATQGSIIINPTLGSELGELHDVLISNPQNRDVLTYNSITGVWENAGSVVDILAADLQAGIAGSTLVPERQYKITDFITPTSDGVTVTPIVVRAKTTNQLYLGAYDPAFPLDIIWFEGDKITYRKDPVNNLSAPCDWRTHLVELFEVDDGVGGVFLLPLAYTQNYTQIGTTGNSQKFLMFPPDSMNIEVAHQNNHNPQVVLAQASTPQKVFIGTGIDWFVSIAGANDVRVDTCCSALCTGEVNNAQFFGSSANHGIIVFGNIGQGTQFFGFNDLILEGNIYTSQIHSGWKYSDIDAGVWVINLIGRQLGFPQRLIVEGIATDGQTLTKTDIVYVIDDFVTNLILSSTPEDGDVYKLLFRADTTGVILYADPANSFVWNRTVVPAATGLQLDGLRGDYVEIILHSNKWHVKQQNFGYAPETHALQHRTGGSDPVNMHSFHGVLSRATVSPLPTHLTSTTFTLACGTTSMTYYIDGVKVIIEQDLTTVLDGAAGFYYIYWDDAIGTLANSTEFPGIYPASTNVLIASVWWNGTNLGLVNDERHGYDRDQSWHTWAHRSVGTRWSSGLDLLTLTGTGATATATFGAGEILDEDITFTIPASASFATPNAYRLIYRTGATTYAFVSTLSTVPFYRGANNRPNVVNSTGYVLSELASSPTRYINFFVYATTDVLCPIYIITETASNATVSAGGYISTTAARAVPWPNLTGVAVSAEMKPLYRVVVRADGAVQAFTAADDYRSVASLPQSAGTSSTTASAVSFAPAGNIASTTVQQAIEELDTEKQATLVSGANIKTINSTSILGSGDIVITGGATIVFPFYKSTGVLDTIALVSNTHLPFTDAVGATKNILLTT